MKRKLAALKTSLLAAVLAVMLAACSVQSTQAAVPDLGQVRSICSLATLECYYHNVAKSTKTAGGGITGIFERVNSLSYFPTILSYILTYFNFLGKIFPYT